MPTKPEIPNFEITTYCGSGAYGDVWLGKDRDGVKRAVKVLDIKRLESLGVLQREEKAVKLFRTQSQRHPNLIEIFYAGETDQHIYYIMELADKFSKEPAEYKPDSLAERLRQGDPLPLDECLKIINQVLGGVEHLHNNDLMHRDIKPSNILFIDGVAKLADIGLVSSSSSPASLVGTPGFFPPDGEMGPEADLYALGKLLYCMYTGRPADDFPSLPDCDKPEELKKIKFINKVVVKACDTVPNNRFKSVEEFRQGLTGHLPANDFRRRIWFELTALVLILSLCGNYWYKNYQSYVQEQKRGVSSEREASMKEVKQAINYLAPSKAYQLLNAMEKRWPEWTAQDYTFKQKKKQVESMIIVAEEMGGEKYMSIMGDVLITYHKEPKQALKLLEKVWQDPQAKKALIVISSYANVLAETGNKKKALGIYKHLDDPEIKLRHPGEAYRDRAEFLIEQGRYQDALNDMNKAIEYNPDKARFYARRAKMKSQYFDDQSGAKRDYLKASKLQPENKDLKKIIKVFENVP